MDKKGDRKSPSENTTLKQRHSHSTNGDVKDKSNLLDIMHQERQDREKIVLWRKPLKTIHFSCLETASLLNQAGKKLWRRKVAVVTLLLMLFTFYLVYITQGTHQPISLYTCAKQKLSDICMLGTRRHEFTVVEKEDTLPQKLSEIPPAPDPPSYDSVASTSSSYISGSTPANETVSTYPDSGYTYASIMLKSDTGQAGGNYYKNKGGGSNYLCLPRDPENGKAYSYGNNGLYGAEYQIHSSTKPSGLPASLGEKEVPCAVCRRNGKVSVLMIPGKKSCYKGWQSEYSGFLMSEHIGHNIKD
ncbi:Hypothetical predicted protein [Mytilus galloprovincialis]|nr:Hypothetical predicted protein [Mytilus galloprovincialis]